MEAEAQLARETRLRNRLRLALAAVTLVLVLALGFPSYRGQITNAKKQLGCLKFFTPKKRARIIAN